MVNKIINDSVHGFIAISNQTIFKLVEHPYFQRLRRIKQLGLTHLIYPSATHTRFQHALGAMHLGKLSLEVLKAKGNTITEKEFTATCIATLLHDIGHGPFSHTLENQISKEINHEKITKLFIKNLIPKFGDDLTLALAIFENKYDKKFLHQLVSSQLDVDRLDYLNRDSFYTGVSEGIIGVQRIISMFNVIKNQLVVEQKGLLSIEKFLLARRFMYWEVYLHKTVVSAESLLINTVERAKYLLNKNIDVDCPKPLKKLLKNEITYQHKSFVNTFSDIDDCDILQTIKQGKYHKDRIFSTLCKMIINRELYKVDVSNSSFPEKQIESNQKKVCKSLKISPENAKYFVFQTKLLNNAYKPTENIIKILKKNKEICNFSEVTKMTNTSLMSSSEEKWFYMHYKISI